LPNLQIEAMIHPIGVSRKGRNMAKVKARGRPSKSKWRTVIRKPKVKPGIVSHPSKFDAINRERPGDSIGARYDTPLQAAKLLESGLPFRAIERLQKASGLTRDRIKEVTRISEGSFSRRKKTGRLSLEESERVLRLSRIFERATSLYDGDQNGARQWLETPIPALDNQRPLDLSQTEPGAREVEDLIGRIEHGIVS
jgi:putative toxin-antitoxin system antitoxin component (TIGR02293 family)